MKKRVLLMIAALLLISAAFAGAGFLSYAANLTPAGVKHEFFAKINAIEKSGNNFFVADKNAVYMFDKDYNETAAVIYDSANRAETVQNPAALLIFDRILFVQDNTDIKLFDIENRLSYLGVIPLVFMPGGMALKIDKAYPTAAELFIADNSGSFSDIIIIGLELTSIQGGNYIEVGPRYLNYGIRTPIQTNSVSIKKIVCYEAAADDYGLIYFGEHPYSEAPEIYEFSLYNSSAKKIDITYGNSNIINDAYFSASGKELVCAAGSGIFSFSLSAPNKYCINNEYKAIKTIGVLEGRLGTAAKIIENNGVIYVSDADNRSVQSFNLNDFSFRTNIFCGASSDKGHFNSPSSVSTANGKVYVADTINNRIQIISDSSVSFINYNFTAPTEVIADIEGGAYVVDRTYTRLMYFNPSYAFVYTKSWTNAYISDIALSLDDTLYVCNINSRVIYKKTPESDFETLLDLSQDFIPKRIAHSPNKKVLYILGSDNNVYSFRDGVDTVPRLVTVFPTTINDISVDYKDNIFALTNRNELYAYTESAVSPVPLNLTGRNETLVDAVSLHIATEDDYNNGAMYSYGDLFICDKGKSLIKRLPKEETGVYTVNTDDYRHEIDYETATAFIIKKVAAKSQTPVYPYPFNSKRLLSLTSNDYVIVLCENLSDNDYFSEVLYQNPVSGECSPVYMLKSQLTGVTDEAPSYTDGRTLHETNKIYKYPMAHSPAIKINGEDLHLGKSKLITLLDFVPGYKDNTSARFYKIQFVINNVTYQGYINTVNVVSKYLAPVTVLPAMNATVRTDNVIGAPLYELIDDEYVPVKEFLPLKNGSKVHIIGTFDSSSTFTEIYIINADGDVFRFYIESSNITADGLSAIQIIAIVLIILIILVGIVILITKRRAFVLRNRENPV